MWRYEVRSCRRWALHLEHCTAPGQDRHRGGRAGRVLGAAQFRSNPYGENISSSSRMFWPAAAAALSLALSGQYLATIIRYHTTGCYQNRHKARCRQDIRIRI